MKINEINTVCFIGAGTMGCFNSMLAALAGYRAILFDVSAVALANVDKVQSEIATFLISSGFCSTQDITNALKKISLEPNIELATENADLVSESIIERLDAKRELHQRLESLCPAHCIITTNTSALKVSEIEDVLDQGDKFAALHSHLGATLIDIVAGPRTVAATIERLKSYVLSLNCVPLILNKEHPGYVLNAMLGPVLTVSMMLVIEGACALEDVDRAWMSSRTAQMGPFGMMDLFGLNVVADSWQKPAASADMEIIKSKINGFLLPYIERNELGQKSAKGFYNYPSPDFETVNFLESHDISSGLADILTATLIESAILIAHKNVVSSQDVDLAWTVGMSLSLGPFEILAELGIPKFEKLYDGFVAAGVFSLVNSQMVKAYLQQNSY